jgi:DNA-binding protein H-NS
MVDSWKISPEYRTGVLVTPSGWQVSYTIEDAQHAYFDVVGQVTINRVSYRVHGKIRPSAFAGCDFAVTLRREGTYSHYGTDSARKKAMHELQSVYQSLRAMMSQQHTTRDAMLAETQAAISKIEAHMAMLQKARAALAELAETISDSNDAQLVTASRSTEREKIASYYEPRQADIMPYWCQLLEKKIS